MVLTDAETVKYMKSMIVNQINLIIKLRLELEATKIKLEDAQFQLKRRQYKYNRPKPKGSWKYRRHPLSDEVVILPNGMLLEVHEEE